MSSAPQHSRVRPRALRPGDKVGIAAPASNVKREMLEAGCDGLRRAGYEPFYFESILERDLYFAGSAERRARELEDMFARDDIRAIICARGGYGSNYVLPRLDLKTIAAHPKIFVGYSDLTTLLTAFTDTANFVTFHGPMVAKDFALSDGVDFASWQNAVTGSAEWKIGNDSAAKPLVAGEAEGTLYGGCLSILVAALGTANDIRTEGTILFLEDVAAKPFQIDRMLMQLKLAGKLTRSAWHYLWRNAGLPPKSYAGLHPRRSCAESGRRSRYPCGIWIALGPCLARQHHAALRRESPSRSGRRSEPNDS